MLLFLHGLECTECRGSVLSFLPEIISDESVYSFFFSFLMFIFEREKQCAIGGGTEKGRHNPKQALGSELSVQSPTQGSNLQRTMRS